MSNDKIKIRTAKSELNSFHFSKAHGTTNKMFHPTVPFIMEVMNDTITEINMSSMRRIDPMPLPPLSLLKFNTRYYFVPMIDICPYFYELDNKLPYQFRYGTNDGDMISKIPTKVPTIMMSTILGLFFKGFKLTYTDTPETIGITSLVNGGIMNSTNSPNSENKNPASDYVEVVGVATIGNLNQLSNIAHDFRLVVNNRGTYIGQVLLSLTERGRNAYKLLKQLGYDITLVDVSYNVSEIEAYNYNTDAHNDIEFSAMPLLAFLKVMLNYYENSAFINNTTRLKRLGALCHIDVDAYQLLATDLDLIFDQTVVMTYERDYFTTNFINPIAGNNFGDNSEYYFVSDPTVNNVQALTQTNSDGTPVLGGSNNNLISDTGIKLLRRLTNFMRRHQIAGGRVVDRALAEFGVSIEDSYSRRTSYIDTVSSVMNITPVLNTTSEQLGDYAGFGSSFVDGNKNPNWIKVKSGPNRGYIIAIDTIVPEIYYSQGYNRMVRHITKTDFLTPDFDAVSVQNTEVGEIYMTHQGIYPYVQQVSPATLTFGHKPRYAEYKEMYNQLTGDFILDSVNTDIDGYFTDRRFSTDDYLDENNQISVHFNRAFCSTYGSGQFARIFYLNSRKTDYIKSVFRFEIKMTSPMKPLYEDFKLDDDYSNNEVTTTVGGQTMV